MSYVWAFVVGGAICVVGQLFIDYTKLSPARILTGYVVAGVILALSGCTSRWRISPGRGPACRCWGSGIYWHRACRMPWTSAACPVRLPAA